MKITTRNAHETIAFGKYFGKKLEGGEILLLSGELGSGKTTFIQGLAKGLKIHQHITSPTFTILKEYLAKKGKIKKFIHIDCYRIESVEDVICAGAFEYFGDHSTVVAIEWPEILENALKKNKGKIISFQFSYNKTTIEENVSQRTIDWRSMPNQQHEKFHPES